MKTKILNCKITNLKILVILVIIYFYQFSAPLEAHYDPFKYCPELLDYARLSFAVYQVDPINPFGDAQKGMWQLRAREATDTGLNYDLYERISASGKKEWVLSFAGTEFNDRRGNVDFKDMVADIQQGTSINKTKQYKEALNITKKYINIADKDPNLKISVTGHSLGGGIAQYVSLAMGIKAVVFDSAPLGPNAILNTTKHQRDLANVNILNIRLDGDMVSRIPGEQHGQIFTIYHTQDIKNQLNNRKVNVIDKIKITHDMKNLISCLEHMHTNNTDNLHNNDIPGYWSISKTDNKNIQIESRALAIAASGVKRALVYGRGAGADSLADNLSMKLGRDNVFRVTKSLSMYDIQEKARAIGVDRIVGFRESFPEKGISQQKVLMPSEKMRSFASKMITIGSALKELEIQGHVKCTAVSKIFKQEHFNKIKKYQNYSRIGEAAINDLRRANMGELTFMSSDLVHESYEMTRDMIESKLIDHLVETKVIDQRLAFGVSDFAKASFRIVRDKRVDVDSITYALDGLVKVTFGALGMVASGGNVKVASAYAELGGVAAETLRGATLGLFKRGFSLSTGKTEAIIEQWRMTQNNNIRVNAPVQSFREFVGSKNLNDIGVSEKLETRLDQEKIQLDRFRSVKHNGAPPVSQINRNAKNKQNIMSTVPSYWTSYDVQDSTKATMIESQYVTRMGREAKRALVVGRGEAADRMYSDVVKRIGEQNVMRVKSNPTQSHLQRIARNFRAEVIFGCRPVLKTAIKTTRRIHVRERIISGKRFTDVPDVHVMPRVPNIFDHSNSSSHSLKTDSWKNYSTNMNDINRYKTHSFEMHKVGGVMFTGTAEVGGGDFLTSGNFSVIFKNSDMSTDIGELRKFITALWAVYFSKEGPGVSIDPIGNDVDVHLVRYIGEVINTDLGRVMREADYLMKKWAVGTERADLPGFERPDEISKRLDKMIIGGTSRFWFVPEKMRYRLAGNSLMFDSGIMTLRTEVLSNGNRVDEANNEFARQFTERYEAIADKYPIYKELFEYSKRVSLARYLKEKRIPMLWFLLSNKDMIITEDSPGTVNELVKVSDNYPNITIKGGVDLDISPKNYNYIIDDVARKAIAKAATQRLSKTKNTMTQYRRQRTITVEEEEVPITITESTDLSISVSALGGDVYQTDLAYRIDDEPGLELIRYYSPESSNVSTFGPGWHLLVPYRVRPTDEKRIAFQNVLIPGKMNIENLLTGKEEILAFDDKKYTAVGYLPDVLEKSSVIGLFLWSNGSFRLVDKMGCQFHFDTMGELQSMLITDRYKVFYEYEVISDELDPRLYREHKLVSEGKKVDVDGVYLPEKIVLVKNDEQERITFNLDTDNLQGLLRYLPELQDSEYREIAVMTDCSFRLVAKGGRIFKYDNSGLLNGISSKTIKEMKVNNYKVVFDYIRTGLCHSIAKACTFKDGKNDPMHIVRYSYDDYGRLSGIEGPNDNRQTITYSDDAVLLAEAGINN